MSLNFAKPGEPVEIEENIRNLVQTNAVHQPEGGAGEQVSTIVSQVSLASTREIDRLIGDLKDLRDRLENEGNHLQIDVIEYASLSQSALQLTKIVSDSVTKVKRMSDAPSGNTRRLEPIVPREQK